MKIIISEDKLEKVQELIQKQGAKRTIQLMGGPQNLLRLFGGGLKEFYKTTGYVPYKFDSTGENMYIDEMLIQSLNLKNDWSGKEKVLGDFRWTSSGTNYKFTAYVSTPFNGYSGQEFRRVLGTCGDSGFGYSFISKRNTIGKRGRAQIFKQIIEKYNLNSYL
jgi:hypothetical protein